jgi:hypothetical protein
MTATTHILNQVEISERELTGAKPAWTDEILSYEERTQL